MNTVVETITVINKDIKKLNSKTLSVSKCIGYCHKEFDSEGTAKKCFEKGYNDPESKYYQMTTEAILESWETKAAESRHYGSMVDDYIGLVLNNKTAELESWKMDNSFDYNKRLQSLCLGFNQFYKIITEQTDYRYVAREIPMFIKSNKTNEYVNGRFDCLFYSASTGKYLIVDWKTNASIDKSNKWEKMLGPLYEYDACNLNEYSIQVYMYKKALCETYNLSTSDNVDVYICQFLDNPNASGTNFNIHKPGFKYDSQLIDNIIEFCYKKNAMK